MIKTEITLTETKYKYSKKVYLNIKDTIKFLSRLQHELKKERATTKNGYVSDVLKNKTTLFLLDIIYAEVRNKQEYADSKKASFGHMKNKTFSDSVKRNLTIKYKNLQDDFLQEKIKVD